MGKAKRVVVPAAVLAISMPLLVHLEGLKTRAYQDVRGIWTICVGDTAGVSKGDMATSADCMTRLQDRLPDYYGPLTQCIPTLPTFPAKVQAAMLSFTYNVGTKAACTSMMASAANAGDIRTACTRMMNFQRAGANPTALRTRREQEVALCLEGVK